MSGGASVTAYGTTENGGGVIFWWTSSGGRTLHEFLAKGEQTMINGSVGLNLRAALPSSNFAYLPGLEAFWCK